MRAMDCNKALNGLVRLMDGEAPDDDRPPLEAHLAECFNCRTTYDAMRLDDALLLRAFKPRRIAAAMLAERVIEQLQAGRRRHQRVRSWATMLSAAAAGFLLAVLMLRQPPSTSPSLDPPVAQFAPATGTVEDPELAERLNDLLAQVGRAEMSRLYEDEIRRVGSRAGLPLLRYVESPRSQSDTASRHAAARIAGDLADKRVLGDLVALLGDDDPEVRFHAARALHRVSGTDRGHPPEAWKDDPLSCQSTREAWQEWWQLRSTKRSRSL
jgi:hypothetical protein